MVRWVHSQHGVPWTAAKMRHAVQGLRDGASVGFAFGADPHAKLIELDDKVLAKRPDLVLHVWSTRDGGRLSDEDLAALTSLSHVRNLEVSGFKNKSLDELGEMTRLELLTIRGKLGDLGFVGRLVALESMTMVGAVPDLAPLAACRRLATLLVQSATLRSLAFVAELPRLRALSIDSATVECDLEPIARVRSLVELSFTSNRGVEDVSFLHGLGRVESLRLDQPSVVTLPSLSTLRKLAQIHLQAMKAWSNPEALAHLPAVRSITLREINPKLPAERFFFLADMKRLEQLDVRWIDYGKRRRQKLTEHLIARGRSAILAE